MANESAGVDAAHDEPSYRAPLLEDLSHAARNSDASAGRRESRRHHPSAVTGSIILRTSVTMEAGNPLRSACSWISASSSAR